jgi:hypothetical protein
MHPQSRDFLKDITVEHGPVDLLGRFFLKAEQAARQRGVFLSFDTFENLLETNERNRENWRPLIPVFNPKNGGLTTDNSFCILGRNYEGDVVAAHAGRLYNWPNTTYYEEAAALRLFYADPDRMKCPGEECKITAQATRDISGNVVFSGAAWYRPDYRGCNLSAILPKLGKAYAYTRWNPDTIVSMMVEDVYQRGFAPRFGYNNVDWEILMRNSALGNVRMAFVWMDMQHLIDDLARFSAQVPAEIDSRILKRRA